MCISEEYKDFPIRNLHDALSGQRSLSVPEAAKYSLDQKGPSTRTTCHRLQKWLTVYNSEASKTRCMGITIEARPDYCVKRHISDMFNYGCTRLEIDVQSVYEDVARDTNRGHTIRAVCESFQLGNDNFYKIKHFFLQMI